MARRRGDLSPTCGAAPPTSSAIKGEPRGRAYPDEGQLPMATLASFTVPQTEYFPGPS
jgi:hypothetical protein